MRRQRNLLGPQGMGGMVGLWGASSMVTSGQQANITIPASVAANSNTSTISSVDTNRSIILWGGVFPSAYNRNDLDGIRVALTNATTVTATRSGVSAADSYTAYSVMEFQPGVIRSVQRGTATMSSTTVNNTLTEVNRAKSFVTFLGITDSDVSSTTQRLNAYMYFSSSTNLAVAVYSAQSQVVGWQVVEFF